MHMKNDIWDIEIHFGEHYGKLCMNTVRQVEEEHDEKQAQKNDIEINTLKVLITRFVIEQKHQLKQKTAVEQADGLLF